MQTDQASQSSVDAVRDLVGALSERTEQDVVSFAAVAQDLRKTTELLLDEVHMLRSCLSAYEQRTDALERTVSTQQQQHDTLSKTVVELAASHANLQAQLKRVPAHFQQIVDRLENKSLGKASTRELQPHKGNDVREGLADGRGVNGDDSVRGLYVIFSELALGTLASSLQSELARLRPPLSVVLSGSNPLSLEDAARELAKCDRVVLLLSPDMLLKRRCMTHLRLAMDQLATPLIVLQTSQDCGFAELQQAARLNFPEKRLVLQEAEWLLTSMRGPHEDAATLLETVDAGVAAGWRQDLLSDARRASLKLSEELLEEGSEPQQLLSQSTLTLAASHLEGAYWDALAALLPQMRRLETLNLSEAASRHEAGKCRLAELLRDRVCKLTRRHSHP